MMLYTVYTMIGNDNNLPASDRGESELQEVQWK